MDCEDGKKNDGGSASTTLDELTARLGTLVWFIEQMSRRRLKLGPGNWRKQVWRKLPRKEDTSSPAGFRDRDLDGAESVTVPRDRVRTFLLQSLIHHLIVAKIAPRKAESNSAPRETAASSTLESWLAGMVEVYFSAATLEVVAGGSIRGSIAVESFLTTVDFVRCELGRKADGGPEDRTPRFFLSAFSKKRAQDLDAEEWQPTETRESELRFPSISKLDLWPLLVSRVEILEICKALIDNGPFLEAAVSEFHAMVKEVAIFQGRPEIRDALVEAFEEEPAGDEAWFFDLPRLLDILGSIKKVSTAKEPEAVDLAAVESARALFVDSLSALATKRLEPHPEGRLSNRPLIEFAVEEVWRRAIANLRELANKPPEGGGPPPTFERSPQTAQALLGTKDDPPRRIWIRSEHPVDADRLDCKSRPDPKLLCRRVTIFGAGIAGLTAAHELAERGFEVTVVEAQPPANGEPQVQVGGVARTQWHAPQPFEAQPSPPGLSTAVPGEHGYRLFPSFYRHVFDTMRRTPLSEDLATGVHTTALNQLEPTFHQIFARRRELVPLRRSPARSIEAFRQEYMRLVEGLGFERRDLSRFFFKLLRYLMTSSARRAAEYENMDFMTFLGGESFYSKNFADNIKAAAQALVAMDATSCDARTQGNVYLQLLMDQLLGSEQTDSTLRGPTSQAWFAGWRAYLHRLGVRFLHARVRAILRYVAPPPKTGENQDEKKEKEKAKQKEEASKPEERRPEIILELPSAAPPDERDLLDRIALADHYVVALDPVSAERVTRYWNGDGVPKELIGFTSHVKRRIKPRLHPCELIVALKGNGVDRQRADDLLRRMLSRFEPENLGSISDKRLRGVVRSVAEAAGHFEARGQNVDELRILLWFERRIAPRELQRLEDVFSGWISYMEIDRPRILSEELDPTSSESIVSTPRLPAERFGESAEDRLQTFTGIQYSFDQDFKLVRGHTYFPETEWGLSAISQAQFWTFDDTRRGVLSVDIGDCSRRSSFTGKSLLDSSADEIAKEVWRQIKDSLRSVRGKTSVVTNLELPEPTHYHLDSNLVFSGGKLQANTTPFLINNAGDWDRRPRCQPWVPARKKVVDPPRTDVTDVWQAPHGGYRIHDQRVVFCGHYMRTFTRMTTMEAANESARHAVNAILDHITAGGVEHSGKAPISGDYCEIWDPEEHELQDLDFFKRVDELLFKAGKKHIADILQFDKIADLQHPDATSGQALIGALGSAFGKDWGVNPQEAIASLGSLMEIARTLHGQLGNYDAPIKSLRGLLDRTRP